MSPGEIVRSVRDSYKRVLLEPLAPTSDGLAVDPETGELVPGVSFRQSSPYVSTRFDKGGRESVIDALRAGSVALDLAAAPQLEGGQG
jgi:hypothetical protein